MVTARSYGRRMKERGAGSDPGGSAQREYERRRDRDAGHRRRTRSARLIVTVATPIAAYAVARFGFPAAYRAYFEVLASSVEGAAVKPFDPDLAHLLGLLAALGATATVVRALWGRRQSTEAWAKGAQGERMTASALDRLPDGYVAVHDLRMPGSRANIDHVVIGPTGVFTVETKHYSSDVVISGKQARVGRRSLSPVVEQAQRQAAAVSAMLGTAVMPVVVVQGSGVQLSGWFTKPIVDGVRFCSGRRLNKVLTGRRTALSSEERSLLVARLR